MERKSKRFALVLAAFAISSLACLPGCGGGDDEAKTTTVGKEMAPTWFGLPEPGAALKEDGILRAAGIQSLGFKCGALTKTDANGTVLATIYATFVVLIDIQTNDTEAATRLGFVEANPKFMGSVSEVFDCASRSM